MTAKTWFNGDGLLVRFHGAIGRREQKTGVVRTAGNRNEMELDVDLVALGAGGTGYSTDRNNDGTKDGFCGLDTPLPVGAHIENVKVITVVTPAGGTNYNVGTYGETGTAIDADGLIAAGVAGAQVGTTLAAKSFVAANVTGTYTAGKLKVIITYLR